jgi:antitoxin component of RelBE/YafQ-DinJ toxin-antitoxin module
MPITIKNEGEDVLADVLNTPGRGYDPARWQNEANGRGDNRVFAHQDEGHVVEQIAPQPPISRMIALPETESEILPAIQKFLADNTDLGPHQQALDAEVRAIATRVRESGNAPGYTRSDILNLAVSRICKANNLPLEREAPLPAPIKTHTVADELARLNAEARKVRTPVNDERDGSRVAALRETTPRARRK